MTTNPEQQHVQHRTLSEADLIEALKAPHTNSADLKQLVSQIQTYHRAVGGPVSVTRDGNGLVQATFLVHADRTPTFLKTAHQDSLLVKLEGFPWGIPFPDWLRVNLYLRDRIENQVNEQRVR